MKFLSGLFETKGEEEVRHSMAGRAHTWEGMPYKLGWSVERAVRDGIERSSIVYKCVDTIATAGSRLPVVVREGGREPQHEVIEGHPLSRFFGGMVNEFETGSQFLYRLITLFLLAKQGVPIEVTRSRMGKVNGIYILPPDQTMPVPGRGKFIDHWRIEAADGEVYELAPENVLWVRRPHPTDPYASLTPMEAAGITIDVDFYARLFNRDFMLSDGRPSGLISVKGVRDDDVDELNRRFRGSGTVRRAVGSGQTSHGAAAGEISVVDSEKVDFVDLHTSQRDAQYVESMGQTKDDIMLAFGVPESVMGNASGRTFDNADAEKEVFWEATMIPGLDMIFTALDALTGAVDDDEFLCADTSSVDVLQRAQREREDRLQAQYDKGLINIDEYRSETGRDPWGRPGSRVGYVAASGKVAVGTEADEKAVSEMVVLGSPEPEEPGGAPGAPSTNGHAPLPQGVGAKGRSTRRTQAAERKHAQHDQSSHGNWVKGPRLIDIRDDHARMNLIDRFEVRDGSERLGTVHRHGDEDGPWVARRLDGQTTEHGTDKDAAVQALRETGPGTDPEAGEPFHPAFLQPGDTFTVEGHEGGPYTLELAWVHRQGDTSLRVGDGVVKLGDDRRVRLVQTETKHGGPGVHSGTGSPQAIHAAGVAGDGRGGVFEVVRRTPVDFLAKALPDAGYDYHDVMADPERGQRIREAYLDAPSDTPEAKRAYAALAMEIEEQYRLLTEDLGVDVQVVDADPYVDVDELMADLQENKTLKVLSTAATGSHPFFTDEQNDQFRAVHDAFGHAGTGRGFDRHGEEAAWAAHSQMFGTTAARAMTTETRGQNSTMVWGGEGFPEQKVALLPDFAQNSEVTLRGQKSMTPADRDNLYHLSGVHHASNGRWKAGVESKHLGPGPHPSGSPQSVHGSITPVGIGKRTMRGGLTVRLGENVYPDGGYAVSVHPEATRTFSVEEFKRDSAAHVRQYVQDNEGLLSRENRYLGTWLDTETERVYLDVSIVLNNKDTAMMVARQHVEKAIFDFSAMEDVRVEDTEGAPA